MTVLDDKRSSEVIDKILLAFGYKEPRHTDEVPKVQVLSWMKDPSLQVQGALYSAIVHKECADRITPLLSFDDYYEFAIPYLERCIRENPDNEWCASRYLAGHALAVWINDLWNKEDSSAILADIKTRLATLYAEGDVDVRDGIVNGVLEHLFEHKPIANYFRDWENDPILGRAYRDASAWSR